MKSIFLIPLLLVISNSVFALCQSPVEVADLTIKVGAASTEELFYSFAEGDQIIFSFEEIKGKALKEVEVIELPIHSKFMDFGSTKIENKKITVHTKGVYKFSFRNTALKGRVCKIHIQRIPASLELVGFNTGWKWVTQYDTVFTPYTEDSLVGYDTLFYKESGVELDSSYLKDEIVIDKTQKVHSYFNPNSSYTSIRVIMPSNIKEKYREERTVAWGYWIGVGDEARQAYAKNVQAMGELGKGAASIFFSPLAGLAVGSISELLTPKTGDDVEYRFMNDGVNAQLYISGKEYRYIDKGKGVGAYGTFNNWKLNGDFFITLHNDNNSRGIDVNVKIVVVREIKKYIDVEYERFRLSPQYVTLNKVKYNVTSQKVRKPID